MLRFFLKRLLHSIPTLIGVSLIAFLLIRLIPGDPVMMMLRERDAAEVVADMRPIRFGSADLDSVFPFYRQCLFTANWANPSLPNVRCEADSPIAFRPRSN